MKSYSFWHVLIYYYIIVIILNLIIFEMGKNCGLKYSGKDKKKSSYDSSSKYA